MVSRFTGVSDLKGSSTISSDFSLIADGSKQSYTFIIDLKQSSDPVLLWYPHPFPENARLQDRKPE